MSKKTKFVYLCLAVIVISIIGVMLVPMESKIEREIEYYEDREHNVLQWDVDIWHEQISDLLPSVTQTEETYTTREGLRDQVRKATHQYDGRAPIFYNDRYTYIWMVFFKDLPNGGVCGEVFIWEP